MLYGVIVAGTRLEGSPHVHRVRSFDQDERHVEMEPSHLHIGSETARRQCVEECLTDRVQRNPFVDIC